MNNIGYLEIVCYLILMHIQAQSTGYKNLCYLIPLVLEVKDLQTKVHLEKKII